MTPERTPYSRKKSSNDFFFGLTIRFFASLDGDGIPTFDPVTMGLPLASGRLKIVVSR